MPQAMDRRDLNLRRLVLFIEMYLRHWMDVLCEVIEGHVEDVTVRTMVRPRKFSSVRHCKSLVVSFTSHYCVASLVPTTTLHEDHEMCFLVEKCRDTIGF